MSERNTRPKTKTDAEIEALLREAAPGEAAHSAGDETGRVAQRVRGRLRSDAALRQRAGNDGLEAWLEDEGRVPRWFIGAAAAAVLAVVGWVTFGPSAPETTPGAGDTVANRADEDGVGFGSMPDRLMRWTGGAERWADAEPLRREARALMDVAGELAGRVIAGMPPEFLRNAEPRAPEAPGGEST